MSKKEYKATLNTITQTNLDEFKKLVRRAIMIDSTEEHLFNAIPDDNWVAIFDRNFNGNFEYARRVLLNKFKEIEKIDSANTARERKKIANLERASNMFIEAINKEIPIVFVTDFDNDGSLAQAIINEYRDMDDEANKTIIVEYAQTVNGNTSRGFTVDHIDLILEKKNLDPEQEFLIVTADNGINSVEEQKKIMEKFPFAKLIVTDHHNPEPDMVVQENDRTTILNPHYKSTPFFETFNISGAATVGVLLEDVLEKRLTPIERQAMSRNYEKLNTLYKVSNLLDYVDAHPADKPEKDFVITKFLRLQPLLNINNSISKFITGEVSTDTVAALEKKIPNLNVGLLHEETRNIHNQNHVAKVLLTIYETYKASQKNSKNKSQMILVEDDESAIKKQDDHNRSKESFMSLFMQEITQIKHYGEDHVINANYIEQLRPLIFSLSASNDNDEFMDTMNDKMIAVYEAIRVSEKRIADELRRGEVITKTRLPNSVIAYADPNILTIFNRKFLNKVYNDENPGFSLTLDSVKPEKVSGSFRSLYNISEILKDKKKLEKSLGVKIETPGHEKAAGFIIRAVDPIKKPVTEKTIESINIHINDSIQKIRAKDIKEMKTFLLTDLTSIPLIDRINTAVRGNVSNFERISPVLKLTPTTVWTDSYTTQQYTMKDITENKKYGYISVNINFDRNTVIVPVELVRRVVESNFEDYLSLSYMDGGVFMVDRVQPAEDVRKVIDLRDKSEKTKALIDAYEQDFRDGNYVVEMSRDQIKDNPFFKYNDYGELDFNLFESMVIGIIDTNDIEMLSVLDVEANGFGNSKLMNIGFMNYMINQESGSKVSQEDFSKLVFHSSRGESYILKEEELSGLRKISVNTKDALPLEVQKKVLVNHGNLQNQDEEYDYYLPLDAELNPKKRLSYTKVSNYKELEDGSIVINRQIQGEMLAYLVKDKDFLVPQEMVNLTGITQEVLDKYGITTDAVDTDIANYYEGKKVLFGAHNTSYDARVARANLKKTYAILDKNGIYDSALFSREQKLAYDNISVAKFEGLKGIKNNIFFYDNDFSDFNIEIFLLKNENGYYPDRTNRYLLEIDNGEYYLVDKEEHEKIRIDANQEEMLKALSKVAIPNTSVKYSVEKLSEQMMVHSLLLCDEKFNIQLVDLEQDKYTNIREYAEDLRFFQENYHFDNSLSQNLFNFVKISGVDLHPFEVEAFMPKWTLNEKTKKPELLFKELDETERYLPSSIKSQQMAMFVYEFMEKNKDIQQKFSDAWMYKQVLSIKDPSYSEINNDLVDLVNYQTAIPKDKIRKIYDDAIRFKKKYGVSHVLQHEMHANGPWRTDTKGDINFEDKLTLLLLANRNYDSYGHSVNEAVRTFNEFRVKAQSAFKIADNLSDEIAQDSYSFRQGILYDRADETLTSMLKTIQEKEARLLTDTNARLIKYKLDNDVLPPETCVYGVIKKDIVLTREQIEDHKKMIGFIVLNKQISNSYSNNKIKGTNKPLEEIIEANKETMEEYSKKLMEFYSFLEFDKKTYQIKQVITKIKDIVFEGKIPGPRTKLNVEQIDQDGYNTIIAVTNDLMNTKEALNLGSSNRTHVEEFLDTFFPETYRQGMAVTEVQLAIDGTQEGGFQQPEAFDFGVDIKRQSPIDRLINHHPEFRLINNYIETTKARVNAHLKPRKPK